MIVNIPFDSILYTLFLRGYLKVKNMIQTFTIPHKGTTEISISIPNKYEAIPYYLKIIPHKDYIFEFKFFIDKKLIIHDDVVQLSMWINGIDFLHQMKVILYSRDEFVFKITNRDNFPHSITINFIYGEIKQDIKEKILNTYFLMIEKEFEKKTKEIKIERLERKSINKVC